MALLVQCAHCSATVQVVDEARGKSVRCPKCSQAFVAWLPGEVPLAQPAPAAAFQLADASPQADDAQFHFGSAAAMQQAAHEARHPSLTFRRIGQIGGGVVGLLAGGFLGLFTHHIPSMVSLAVGGMFALGKFGELAGEQIDVTFRPKS